VSEDLPDFYFIFGELRARDREGFLRRAVHALAQLEGIEALEKEVRRQGKKESGGQKKPIPAEALRARELMNKKKVSPSQAIQEVIGPGTRDKIYKDVYNALQNRQQELDELLLALPTCTTPENIKPAPGLEVEQYLVVRAPKGRSRHKSSKS
jgi:hypothetical protein